MMGRIIAKLVVLALKSKLSIEDKSLVMNALIEEFKILPLYGIIKIDSVGKIIVNNKELDFDKAMQLRESARVALFNQARKLIKEQVAYLAVNLGVHQAINPEQVLFAKAALFNQQEEEKLLQLLAQEDSSE
jgi:hypothetical protein